jgi:hypothetical protein
VHISSIGFLRLSVHYRMTMLRILREQLGEYLASRAKGAIQ